MSPRGFYDPGHYAIPPRQSVLTVVYYRRIMVHWSEAKPR